jgi:type I restriction enzyme S subunit
MSAIGQKTRLRFLLSTPLMYGASESGVEFDAKLPRYIRITDIRPDGTLDPDKAVSLPRNTALPYLLTDRDILLARSGATVGKAFLYRSDGDEACFAGYLIRARCDQRRMLAEYLAYYLQSAGYWDFINSSALQATIQNVSAELYKEILVTHPSVEQQKKVVAYLDEQTRKIDQLMNMRRRQMALLKEQRAAVIQEAVTRGLNPNVPMKDSGLLWVGKIPAYWEVKRLKYVCKVTTGSKDTVDADDDGIYPFFVRSQIIERIGSFSFDGEAVLTAGDGAGVGKVFHHHVGKFDFHQRVYMLYDFKGILGRFVFHYLKENFYKVALEGGAKSTVDSLRMPVFLNFGITIPPIDEQKEIMGFIESESAKTEHLLSAYTRQLELMTEYRAALIHECVTGQRTVPETV